MRRKECPGGGDCGLKVLCESPIAPDPSEETLNNPSARQNSEADLIKMLIDDLNDDAGCGGNTLAGISPSAKTRSMKGKIRREAFRSAPPPSRSWILAGCGSSTRPRPSVSTSAWRLRPLIFLQHRNRAARRPRWS